LEFALAAAIIALEAVPGYSTRAEYGQL